MGTPGNPRNGAGPINSFILSQTLSTILHKSELNALVKMAELETVGAAGADVPKFVVVGDGAVGKTCLCVVYAKGEFPVDYVPTVFENHSVKHNYRGQELSISLWDTAGQEEYSNIRTLSYQNTKVFIVCFSLNRATTFDNLRHTWLPELAMHEPNVPRLLVGTKSDLKHEKQVDASTNKTVKPTSENDIKKLIKEFRLAGYVECSAKEGIESVRPLFEKAIQIHLDKEKRKKAGGGSSPRSSSCLCF